MNWHPEKSITLQKAGKVLRGELVRERDDPCPRMKLLCLNGRRQFDPRDRCVSLVATNPF